ncbi:polyribonucleotide nucleotidyltransferase [Sulfuricurvum kujiense DSM 16994]|uniref:Polyribonucleotide nucleotidyltransferase n=1 Tax=Sulfuricurvum kujiense (strain ATCC BAA-921 / DSM 16994 / JCM 11577 / YK-1) TaxID=709032 RepID=E4TZ05_SULKY|nr:polyribonucleotide nucleotidyltransferase [Sulfuricurvum kujiense]ADR33004.1 polyribonucleotide nucleotidyltransferase [Sulfuricurvum kujiense DSM 16994]
MKYNVELTLQNKTEAYAFNQVAAQANGAAWLKCGDTVILATVVIDETDFVDEDFLPLTVQYIEKSYAAGKFPGGFIKRETKPSDFETLTSRIVDRSLRPLFPKGFANPVQITVMVLSADREADLQVLALNAASAALYVSDIDIFNSVSAVRVGKIDGEIVFNPTLSQLQKSTLDLYLAGSKEDMLMIEMQTLGSDEVEILDIGIIDPLVDPAMSTPSVAVRRSNAMSEDELIRILASAQIALSEANSAYESAFKSYAKPPFELQTIVSEISGEMIEYVRSVHTDDLKRGINQMAKTERSTALRTIRKTILKEKPEWNEHELKKAIESVKRSMVRAQILDEKVRADGRALNEVRPISIETNVLPSAHASALFTRGQTQALVVLTLGGAKDAQMFENLTDSGTQNEGFMVHYNFPGFSVGEPSPIGAPRRRELGHGNLAKRALEGACVRNGQTIRLVSEVLESNGSSSMATVCGGYMALRAGDIEVADPIAGVAMGMVQEGSRHAILTDIMGLEDHDGDLDFKVAGSKGGITAMQMDIKLGGIHLDVLKEALYQAKEARSHIIDIMISSEDKIELNEGTLPSTDLFHIDPSFIGDIIGQAGKTIREIIERFDVTIDIDKKKGSVKLTGKNRDGLRGARDHIEGIVSGATPVEKVEYKVGDVVKGKVKKIVDFGAFIELPGGVDGLIHISKLSDGHVSRVSDVVNEGDELMVEIVEFKGNKIGLGRAK